MRTIDIGLPTIDKIFHIADVHVRNVKRHTEYEQVFKRLYKYIKNNLLNEFQDIKTQIKHTLITILNNEFNHPSDLHNFFSNSVVFGKIIYFIKN